MTRNTINNPADADLRAMLDTAYELEGLLQLAITRDSAPGRIAELIRSKVALLSGQIESAEGFARSDVAGNEESYQSYDLDDDGPEDISDVTRDSVEDASPLIPDNGHLPPISDVAHETLIPDRGQQSLIPDGERQEKESKANPSGGTGMTPVFSINDRFLYARELFGGRMADFDEALKEVAGMDSYEEAEDYFLSYRGFNPDLRIVQDFLSIISNCFA